MLMNNAGIGLPSKSWEDIDAWRKTFDVNVFGCVHLLVSSVTLLHFVPSVCLTCSKRSYRL